MDAYLSEKFMKMLKECPDIMHGENCNDPVDTAGCVGNKIITASGGYFDYTDPKPEDIHIRDIAKALANSCRFSGHCEFYSVAEHSVRCMSLARSLYPDNNELAFAALMHDAAEAYLTDLPKPLKLLCPGYQKVERRVEKVIQEKYGISTEYHDEVKRIDLMMLKAEKAFLFPDCKDKWEGLDEVEDFDFHGFYVIPSMSNFDLFLHFFSVMQQILEKEDYEV